MLWYSKVTNKESVEANQSMSTDSLLRFSPPEIDMFRNGWEPGVQRAIVWQLEVKKDQQEMTEICPKGVPNPLNKGGAASQDYRFR